MKLTTYTLPDEATMLVFSELGGDDFDQMRTYLFELKTSMNNQRARLTKLHSEELKLFPVATALTNSVYNRRYENYDKHFVGLLLNSALAMSYSLFEIVFKKVCFYAAVKKGVVIKKDHFGTSKITERCKKFIEKEIGIDLSKIERYWKLLVFSQGLRNKIIHHGATIPVGNKELRRHVRKSLYIELTNPRSRRSLTFYIKDQRYIFDFIEISSSYLIWILMRINLPNHSKQKKKHKTIS